MNEEDTSNKRIDYLAERLKDDALSESEVAEVQDIVRNQPQARRRLVELLYLAADLREAVRNWHGKERGAGLPDSLGRFAWGAVAGLAAAAALTLMVWHPWTGDYRVNNRGAGIVSMDPANDPEEGAFAVVTRTSDPQWGRTTTLPVGRLERGAPVGAGALEIESGLVQIDFYSGATVILEGPAKILLETPELGRLEYGNLWAHVPPPARGFRIETDAFEVLDLGTEFGMSVDRNGHGEVHVLDGEVEVQSKKEAGKLKRLLTGEGLNLAADGSSNAITARPENFAAAERLSGEVRKRYRDWVEFQEQLRADPDVLVSYDFQDRGAWDRMVPNLASAALPETDGAVVGCQQTEGRWPEKGALLFRNSSHRVRLNLPGEFEDLTLACWVRPDRLESAEVSLLHPETRQERFIHWTLINVEDGVMHVHFSESARGEDGELSLDDRNHYHCKWNLLRGTSLGQWMHLAVAYDSKAGKVNHFLNGEIIGIREIEQPRLLGIGTADIGNWPYHEWAQGTEFEVRNLNGAIGEFLIMKRALGQTEIEKMFEAGRP